VPNARFSAVLLLTIAAMAVASVALSYGLLPGYKIINTQGSVSSIGVGVYWEASCLTEVNTIDWGYVSPSSTKDVVVYVRNEGTVPMTLNMTVEEWIPGGASAVMAVSWNAEGSQVNAQSVRQVTLTLSVASSVGDVSSFSFDIRITGSE
jgi:hypothetical protein